MANFLAVQTGDAQFEHPRVHLMFRISTDNVGRGHGALTTVTVDFTLPDAVYLGAVRVEVRKAIESVIRRPLTGADTVRVIGALL